MNDPIVINMSKPKMMKIQKKPRIYSKKVVYRTQGLQLDTILEEDISILENEINDCLYKELGTFGDIVQLARKQILEGYVRPKLKKDYMDKYIVKPIAPLPKRIENF